MGEKDLIFLGAMLLMKSAALDIADDDTTDIINKAVEISKKTFNTVFNTEE